MRRFSKAVALTLAMAMLLGAASLAHAQGSPTNEASEFDTWRGVLGGRDRTVDDYYYGDAEGHVILNYVKGRGNYVVNLVAEGLKPETEYEVKFLVPDPENDWHRQLVGRFTTDSEGEGHLNFRGFEPVVEEFTDKEHAFFSIYYGAWRVATTWGDATEGGGEDIEPVGSNRGE